MELFLTRSKSTKNSTPGQLETNDKWLAWTLEDVVRPVGEKVYGETAIPPGRYQVIVNHSNAFGREMPLLLDVPGFRGVRLHEGNTPVQTLGCVLVGLKRGVDTVYESRAAYAQVFAVILTGLKAGKVWLTIR